MANSDLADRLEDFARHATSSRTMLRRAATALRAAPREPSQPENWVHDCGAWVDEGIPCANCNVTARETEKAMIEKYGEGWADKLRHPLAAPAPSKPLCARCGHPQDWHRLDDASGQDPTDPDTTFRCIGYDCTADGARPPTAADACDCPDVAAPQEQSKPNARIRDEIYACIEEWDDGVGKDMRDVMRLLHVAAKALAPSKGDQPHE